MLTYMLISIKPCGIAQIALSYVQCSLRTIPNGLKQINQHCTSFLFLITYLNSGLLLCSVCNIQSDIINFQHVLTSFAVFQSFTDLFRELNDGETKNHYKMNSKNVGTWHGIIISPAQHVQKSREGHGENWTHLVYKLDNLFRISGFRTRTDLLHEHLNVW